MRYLLSNQRYLQRKKILTKKLKTLIAVKASCSYPPTVKGGFFIARGVVNHAYMPGTIVKYYCDAGHTPKGPNVITCSGKEWLPKEVPDCLTEERKINGKSSFLPLPLDVDSL